MQTIRRVVQPCGDNKIRGEVLRAREFGRVSVPRRSVFTDNRKSHFKVASTAFPYTALDFYHVKDLSARFTLLIVVASGRKP